MPRLAQLADVPGVAEAIATGDPVECAERIVRILEGGAEPVEVARTAAVAVAHHFAPSLPPPHALPALSAALDLAASSDPPELPLVQACALAATEHRGEALAAAARVVAGDEVHLGRSFLLAVRTSDVGEADAIFSGLLREGEERRLAGDVLFQAATQDVAGGGHKLTFSVGSWRLARALGWRKGPALLRPAVHLLAGAPQDLAAYGATMREVGRSRMDLEIAARNVAPIDEVARNAFGIALGLGADRVVQELIGGLRRGRAPAGYADLVARTAMEHLVADARALETALFALAARFALGFSRTTAHVLAVLQAARLVGVLGRPPALAPARIGDAEAARRDLAFAIEGDDVRLAAGLAAGLAEEDDPALAGSLARQAAVEDAAPDSGHRLIYAAGALEFARVAPVAACASLAAHLARTPKSRGIAEAL